MQEIYDEGEHTKETFAHFGRTYHAANVLEAGLAIAIMFIDFTTLKFEQFRGRKITVQERANYEKEFDVFMRHQHDQTLGNLIRKLVKSPLIDDSLKEEFLEAKKRRDYIAHHYFRDRDEAFISRIGKNSMIEELIQHHDFFTSLDEKLDNALKPLREKVGFSESIVQEELQKLIKKNKDLD